MDMFTFHDDPPESQPDWFSDDEREDEVEYASHTLA